MEIAPSARKHGISDDDMQHAVRHHWMSVDIDDPQLTLYVGPSTTAVPLEVIVASGDGSQRIIHAMHARPKYLKGWLIR